MSGPGRWLVDAARGLVAASRRRSSAFSELWRRSLQLRVVVSTLALGSAVIFVLGMVLQNQITERLLGTKEEAAIAQTRTAVQIAERELAGTNAADPIRDRLNSALNKLTSSSPDQSGAGSAGAFEPVLVNDAPYISPGDVKAAGPYESIPQSLRDFLLSAPNRTVSQIYTVERNNERVTYLIVGVPVAATNTTVQLYMLYPLATEQRTIDVVQSTLVVGGLVLLLLLAGITNLVTRQVVLPVRRAARAAERFADGELGERMVVAGEDDVARLAQSYNEMAASIERQIRQLEDFGQLQRRFTSDVSHELRTPLTTVRMAADVLHASRAQFPAGLARSTELLVDELDRFESLLGDLLEISRLDAGVEELVAEHADLRAIARRAVESVRVIARNAGSEIVLDLPESDDAIAEVESRRVERILRNLLANAIDHGEGKPVELRMVLDDHAVAVTVRDHGVGLRTGEADLVFNRFWRADPSRNRHTGGTGLGLAISLEDARLHGGGLDAWGEPGEGACFRLTLPRTQGEEYEGSPLPLPPADVRPMTHPAPLPISVPEEVYP
ncbi:MtrAB system histidine kinase MtrB [Actinokineospora globicatena]|uniref:Sensor histidine kinase MtrB n=1 Tax=Actinokineospora globicatena TaxID=103729 RepID=A0A9W6QVH7_9PSEU|nr:MtrAB system histidine kinase MtrB [Actinokineospora globicatena]MCP2302119.1 two-component system, OmpR family, sensor histidine kinase MtrB [Actinokineospora globicatena]GLW76219.1 two-component sensor histidine kinase [Actinokineospora globicatena]GLW83055.1 two-component sensor histidine kinase [Actinokineospora globicatena]GLW95334.1 two-component sensor histidine kinase [Actinokineospora globicatena]